MQTDRDINFLFMLKAFYIFLLVAISLGTVKGQTAKWGDQHNGTYANPILPADFHDADVIRVGPDYFLISATNQLSPGILIMSSKDLVNWKIVGHAVNDISRISANYNYDKLHGKGISAATIRYHDNEFIICFADPAEGVFMTSAGKITGPWSPLIQLIKGPGWSSPCPLWNEAGQAYLAATNLADNNKVHVFKMANDGESITTPGSVIQQGKAGDGGKLYKIKNYYYHFYNELTTEGRVPFVERSASATGPYIEHHQLMHKTDHEPNQVAMVQTDKGEWYLLTHHSQSRWDGRELSLVPVTWINDWPVAGTVAGDGIGEMIWMARKPATDANATPTQTSDDFSSKTLSPQWEWYFQPNAEKWSVTERAGYLRLYASKVPEPEVIEKIPNVITQRPWRLEQSIATVKFDIAHMADGQIAALCLFGKTTAIFGVKQADNIRHIYYNAGDKTKQGLEIEIANVWLRAIWDATGLTKFYYSTDGINYDIFGDPYNITNVDNNSSAKIGIYTASDNESGGFIDVDWFHYGLN